MERRMSATEARIHFGELLRRVGQGETVVVERDGTPAAVVVSMDDYRTLRAHQRSAPSLLTAVRRTHERILAELGTRELTPAAEIIRELREERDDELEHLH